MGAGNTNCWAGDIVARNGRYYRFFSNHNIESGVMVADRPEGPYHDALGGPLVDSFDPTIFTEDDGTPYIIYGHGTYYIARLNDDLLSLAEEPQALAFVDGDRGDFPIMDKNSLHKYKGIYYLSCSGYYATASSVYGPYTYRGLVGEAYDLASYFGHGDFFEWKNQWYHVWCRDRNRDHDRIRDCFIAPTHYLADGSMYDDLSGLSPESSLPAWPS